MSFISKLLSPLDVLANKSAVWADVTALNGAKELEENLLKASKLSLQLAQHYGLDSTVINITEQYIRESTKENNHD